MELRKIEEDLKKNEEIKNAEKHYLLVVYDKYNNKFLTYYDENWDCYFIMNTKKKYNTGSLYELFSMLLDTNLDLCKERIKDVKYLKTYTFSKYCVPENKDKYYKHSYWQVLIEGFDEKETGTTFGRNGVRYKWLSLDEMISDSNIRKKNSEVIRHLVEIKNESECLVK